MSQNPFTPAPVPAGNSPIEKNGTFTAGASQNYGQPQPHGKQAPGGTVEARSAQVADLQKAQAKIDAMHAQVTEKATADRVAKGLGTLTETVEHLAKQGKTTATSQKTAPAKPEPLPAGVHHGEPVALSTRRRCYTRIKGEKVYGTPAEFKSKGLAFLFEPAEK